MYLNRGSKNAILDRPSVNHSGYTLGSLGSCRHAAICGIPPDIIRVGIYRLCRFVFIGIGFLLGFFYLKRR